MFVITVQVPFNTGSFLSPAKGPFIFFSEICPLNKDTRSYLKLQRTVVHAHTKRVNVVNTDNLFS